MKSILTVCLIVFISGCDVRVLETDPELRRELFKECNAASSERAGYRNV